VTSPTSLLTEELIVTALLLVVVVDCGYSTSAPLTTGAMLLVAAEAVVVVVVLEPVTDGAVASVAGRCNAAFSRCTCIATAGSLLLTCGVVDDMDVGPYCYVYLFVFIE
jgi:hypothetical protein